MTSPMEHITKDGALCQICFEWILKADLVKCRQHGYYDICGQCANRDGFWCPECESVEMVPQNERVLRCLLCSPDTLPDDVFTAPHTMEGLARMRVHVESDHDFSGERARFGRDFAVDNDTR